MHINKFHREAEEAMKKGSISEGINLMKQAINISPNEAKLFEDLGVIYMHAKLKENCLECFDQALKLEQDNPYRYSSRAFAKNYFKDHDGAISDYEKAIELDPDDAITRNNLGLAFEQKGYYKKAERHFNKSNDILGIKPKEGVEDRIEPDSNKMKVDFEKNESENKPKGVALTSENNQIDTSTSKNEDLTRGKIMLNVFSKKETFKEFIQFVKSGFKTTNDDKK